MIRCNGDAAEEGQPQDEELWLARPVLLHDASKDCSAACASTLET